MNQIILNESELRELYLGKRMTMKEIAKLKGCAVGTVYNRFVKYGIPSRDTHDYPVTDAMRQAWRENGRTRKGHIKSEETRRKISLAATGRRKRNDYEFGGHEKKRSDGYIRVYVPNHPHCTADGYVMKHILVVERRMGRHLVDGEVVHHINHIRDDNRPENLVVMQFSEHARLHMLERHNERRAQNA